MFLLLHVMVPLADVNSAFLGIAKQLAGYLVSIFTFLLVYLGYQYMFAVDDHSKAMQSKRSFGVLIVGSIIVALAVGVGPSFIASIGH